jgi:ATP-dependent RNA helicase RhlE
VIEVARSNATADKVTQVCLQGRRRAEARRGRAPDPRARPEAGDRVLEHQDRRLAPVAHLEQAGIKATAIHGDKTQQERMAALEAFKKGEIDVLVATDVAARGLDISDLPCVINYDLPYNAEDYVHRIGRTGRAGASGDALSVYSDKDERLLADIEKLIKQTITRGELTGFAPAARARASDRGERGERAATRASAAPPRSPDARARTERRRAAPAGCRAARRSIRGSSSPTSRPRSRARTPAQKPPPARPSRSRSWRLALLGGYRVPKMRPLAAACERSRSGVSLPSDQAGAHHAGTA